MYPDACRPPALRDNATPTARANFRQRYDELEVQRAVLISRLRKLSKDAHQHPSYKSALKLLNSTFRRSKLAQRLVVLDAAAWLIDVLEWITLGPRRSPERRSFSLARRPVRGPKRTFECRQTSAGVLLLIITTELAQSASMSRDAAFWFRAPYSMLSSSGLLAFRGCRLISTEKTHEKSSRIVRCFGSCASCARRGYRGR